MWESVSESKSWEKTFVRRCTWTHSTLWYILIPEACFSGDESDEFKVRPGSISGQAASKVKQGWGIDGVKASGPMVDRFRASGVAISLEESANLESALNREYPVQDLVGTGVNTIGQGAGAGAPI